MSKLNWCYAKIITNKYFESIKEPHVIFVNFDGMTREEEAEFVEKCKLHHITVSRIFSTGINEYRRLILSTGGFMDGNVCRPLAYSP